MPRHGAPGNPHNLPVGRRAVRRPTVLSEEALRLRELERIRMGGTHNTNKKPTAAPKTVRRTKAKATKYAA